MTQVESGGSWTWKQTLTLSLKDCNDGSSDINLERGGGERILVKQPVEVRCGS